MLGDLGGSIPNNPCNASTGAAGYGYGYGYDYGATQVSIDACQGFASRSFTLGL